MATTNLINAKSRTVTGTSAKFTLPLDDGKLYRIVGDVAFWFTFGDEDDTAVASADRAVLMPADRIEYVTPRTGNYLHVIRSAVDGNVNIAEVVEVP